MPRKINYPSYQHGGPTDDPERLYKMYLSALEDIDREISNYGTINMDDVYDFPSSPGAASAINREAGLERLFDQKRDLEGSLRRQGKLLGYGGSKYRDGTMGSGRFPGMSAIREEGAGRITDPNRQLGPGSDDPSLMRRALGDIDDKIHMMEMEIDDPWNVLTGGSSSGEFSSNAQERLRDPGRYWQDARDELDRLNNERRAIIREGRPPRPVIENPFDLPRRHDTPAGILRKLMGGKGLKGLLMAGAATAASPLAALADVLISPERLGSGDLPEEDLLTDEQKIRYYQELMNQRERSGLGPGPSIGLGPRVSPQGSSIRPRGFGRASGGIIGLQWGGYNQQQQNQPRYPNTAASQNPSYLQQQQQRQQQRGSNMAGNTVSPANTEGPWGADPGGYFQRNWEKSQQENAEKAAKAATPTQSRVTSYGVPQQTAQQWANLTDRIVGEGQRQYQPYGGQRLAGFTQPEAAAMAGQVAYGQGQGPAGTRQAASTLGQAGQMIGGAQQGLMGLQPQYARAGAGMRQAGATGKFQGQLAGAGMRTTGTAGQTRQDTLGGAAQTAGESGAGTMRGIGTSMAGPEMQKTQDLSPYMSQFTKGVTDPQLQQLMEFQKMQGQELGSQAAQAGAFGGLRQGVQAATQAQDVSQQAADIIGQGQQKAFESAQQAFQADRAAQAAGYGQQLTAEQQAAGQEQQGLAAQRAAEQAGVAMSQTGQQQGFAAAHSGAQFGLQGQQAEMGALGAQGSLYGQAAGMGGQLTGLGGQQAALGQQEQQQQFERLRGMQAAGEKQRQLQQQSLGIGYQDWQNQLNQERSNIGWQQSAMSGLPYQGTVTQSAYEPQTGPWASGIGQGIEALGAYNAFQQNQQPWNQQGATPQSASGSWQAPWSPTDNTSPLWQGNFNQTQGADPASTMSDVDATGTGPASGGGATW